MCNDFYQLGRFGKSVALHNKVIVQLRGSQGWSGCYYNPFYVTYRGKGSGRNTEDFEARKYWIFGAWN